MDSESDTSLASGSDSSNSSAKGLRNHFSPAALSSACEEGSTVKVCGSPWGGVDGGLCQTRLRKKRDLDFGWCMPCRVAESEAYEREKERIVEHKKQTLVKIREDRRLLESRLSWQLSGSLGLLRRRNC